MSAAVDPGAALAVATTEYVGSTAPTDLKIVSYEGSIGAHSKLVRVVCTGTLTGKPKFSATLVKP